MTYLVSIQRFLPAGYLFDCSTVRPENSLFPDFRSLLSRIFSLLICAGNLLKSRCGTAASGDGIGGRSP